MISPAGHPNTFPNRCCAKRPRACRTASSSAPTTPLHLTDLLPGQGPPLHRHPYEEVFVVHEGQASYTVGDTTLEVRAGQIVLVPAGMPHKFINSGEGPLRQTIVHPSPHWIEERLES